MVWVRFSRASQHDRPVQLI